MISDFGCMISQLPRVFIKFYGVPFSPGISDITNHKSPITIPLEFPLRLALLQSKKNYQCH
jgi:hypothetical protein